MALRVVDRPASSDAELVAGCLRGDRTAERELFRREYARVHAVVYRLLGSTRDLDDILQETFIAVFRGLARFRGDAKLSTWIDRIAVHVVIDHIRARKRQPVLLDTVELVAPGGSVSNRAEARDGLRRLYAVLDRLPADARIAFALYAIDGRSIAEVAAITRTSAIAAKLRIWRARREVMRRANADPVLANFLEAAP